MKTKKCPDCKEILPLTQEFYYKNSTKSDGFQVQCIKCKKIYNATHYLNNKNKYKNNANKSRKGTYARYMKIKAQYSCAFCGEDNPCCIDFHHIDPSTKKYAISQLVHHKLDILNEELDKCVALCANCHRKYHAKQVSLLI